MQEPPPVGEWAFVPPRAFAHRGGLLQKTRNEHREFMKSITRQEWFGALVAVLVLGVLLSLASPYFLTTGNLSNILVQASVIALLAGGQTFVILTGGVDLAVGALTALAGAVAGYMMVKLGVNPYLAMLVALAIGASVGLFNGYLVAFVGIPAFIVTLGGLTLWRGLAFDLTGGFDNAGLPAPFPFIGYGDVFGIPMPTLITGIFFVVGVALRLRAVGVVVLAGRVVVFQRQQARRLQARHGAGADRALGFVVVAEQGGEGDAGGAAGLQRLDRILLLACPRAVEADAAGGLAAGVFRHGAALAADLPGNVVGFGEMGIGNTTAAAALMHKLTGIPVAQCVGAGTGLSAEGVLHKQRVIAEAPAGRAGASSSTPRSWNEPSAGTTAA
eukprot:gene20959-23795_t